MTPHATRSLRDPLAAFMAGLTEDRRPVPLVATRFGVTLEAGLAVVETVRRFHNAEDRSIEATVTFPVPVHATLFSLKARIGDRVLTARAESRTGARKTYETAVSDGKSAVLHEEVLRGVHMLSVAHIPPGAEIEVTTLWATTVTFVGEGATLRIPLTVGDVYGHSGLPESDDLAQGGPVAYADLAVQCADGVVELVGADLEKGRAFVPLNAPIDLRIPAWTPRPLTGRAADGRTVTLLVERPSAPTRAIDVAILVDHSSSMEETCSAASDGRHPAGPTKHQAVVDGLVAIAGRLAERDTVDLWEFDDTHAHVGSSRGPGLKALVSLLAPPWGGTEVGSALHGVLQRSTAPDILLITDGKSHALEVQSLASKGRRITVVLVGEDSLEANVGHLAALTGGDIFVAAGADARDVLLAALATLRRPYEPTSVATGASQRVSAHRGGARLTAEWRQAADIASDAAPSRAVAAVAAAMALPGLELWAATEFAVSEGLVTHLTSLVLVDEEGAVQEEIPGMRKVVLPVPRTLSLPSTAATAPPRGFGQPAMARPNSLRPLTAEEQEARRRALEDTREPVIRKFAETVPSAVWRQAPRHRGTTTDFGADPSLPRRRSAAAERRARAADEARRDAAATDDPRIDLSTIPAGIDWDRAPNDLLAGDLSQLDRWTVQLIEEAAVLPEVVSYASNLGISPVSLVVGLLADTAGPTSRSAARVAAALLRKASPLAVAKLGQMLCLF